MLTWRSFIHLLVSLLGLAGVQAEQLPRVESGVSRRAFLQALGVSAVALAHLPSAFALDEPLDLDEPLGPGCGLDLQQFDALLKECYAPLIIEELNRPSMLMHFMGRA